MGEQALRYLGVVSGVLIAVVGALLLREAIRTRRASAATQNAAVGAAVPARVHSHASSATADLGHSGGHDHGLSHEHGTEHDHGPDLVHSHDHGPDHVHSHDHGPDDVHSHDHEHGDEAEGHTHSHAAAEHSHSHAAAEHSHDHLPGHGAHSHEDHDHDHSHGAAGWLQGGHHHSATGHGHSHATPGSATSRAGLVGMGIAGGLVPSPSALVVLLGSVALGRTVFGVLLVLLYGVGMAGTLTAVGLLLVKVRDRFERPGASGRLGTGAARVAAVLPVVTAVLVLVVGLGLAARGLTSRV